MEYICPNKFWVDIFFDAQQATATDYFSYGV